MKNNPLARRLPAGAGLVLLGGLAAAVAVLSRQRAEAAVPALTVPDQGVGPDKGKIFSPAVAGNFTINGEAPTFPWTVRLDAVSGIRNTLEDAQEAQVLARADMAISAGLSAFNFSSTRVLVLPVPVTATFVVYALKDGQVLAGQVLYARSY